jgi:hypothetical protein
VLLVRRIRELLYEQGFTISGARNRLGDSGASGARSRPPLGSVPGVAVPAPERPADSPDTGAFDLVALRQELRAALMLLERSD